MAGIAHIAADCGMRVTGSDIADSKMFRSLSGRGLAMTLGHCDRLPADTDLVVYSSAVGEDDEERRMAVEAGISQCNRGEFLARLAAEKFRRVAAIGGSHGKTTTSAMAAHILKKLGMNPGYMVGGTVTGWERNAGYGSGDILVTEADESDGTQAMLKTFVACILNVDDDHFWSLGGKDKLAECFREFATAAQHVLVFEDDVKTLQILGDMPTVELVKDDFEGTLPVAGAFNRRNAAAAVKIAELMGCERAAAVGALADYPGVERRMTKLFATADGKGMVIEDYAHHPTELEALLSTIHQEYSEAQILAYFQPHRFERLEYFGERFAGLLAQYCEETTVVAPFAAWHENARGITAEMLVTEINRLRPGSAVQKPCEPAELAGEIKAKIQGCSVPTIALVIGAGDVGNIRNFL